MLQGKKTYILGIIAMITVIGQFLSGDMPAATAINDALTFLMGMTIRRGIANK